MDKTAENAAPARIAEAMQSAEEAGLRYVSPDRPGIRREREGDGFAYVKPNGEPIEDEATLSRIRKLAIPPAWTEVWICPSANGHLQATGRDARGRKQYRYHAQFREVRESNKYQHMLEFARALPAIRARVAEHMALPGLPREKVLATVVHLLETTLIRVGNDDYARDNNSFGLTTLRNRHVKVEGTQLRFQFTGKSGKTWRLQTSDRRVARIVRACQELPGQELFAYVDEQGQPCDVSSDDVNAYLREITGQDVTAKDFRTWAGTVMAALALHELEAADTQQTARKNLKAAIEHVASRLGNTPAICRKCYVHPEILDAYVSGGLLLQLKRRADAELRDAAGLKEEERAVLKLLDQRINRSLEGALADSLVALNGKGKGKGDAPPKPRQEARAAA
ncbi:DNA topoisomerase IB [Ramlibacter sp. AW1]|uniref:DNA topoisomerase n=1 Tax=Ramlibacter aurantiacus TaxID=2801330 RepID=A0A936ZRW7_9BURK|nr:DNA topoisomerase IB [Ramlibacter aurantiacus]MBL0419955.1 DNA topoisomerase IB [Ramlibacter aurantiacus]